MKLVAMLRIKNQILTIKECLTKLSELVDEIVVVDNGSTDDTFQAYKEFSKVVKIKKTKGFHEGRDKCLAHKLAKRRKPDWILWIDGDEIFEKATSREDLKKYMQDSTHNLVKFRMYNFWLSKIRYRVDGIWGRYNSFPQRQMWRNLSSAYFRNIPFHNGGIMGVPGRHLTSLIRLKHYGFIRQEQIKAKNDTYEKMKNDPMAKKTLPVSTKGMVRWPWLESDNRLVNRLMQIGFYLFWGLIEKIQTIKDLIQGHSLYQKLLP